MRVIRVFEVESRLAIPPDLAMSPGMIIIDDNRISTVETAVFIGPGSPEVATVEKFLVIAIIRFDIKIISITVTIDNGRSRVLDMASVYIGISDFVFVRQASTHRIAFRLTISS